jgi:hypothetical protein
MVKLHKAAADIELHVATDICLHAVLFCIIRRRLCQRIVFFSCLSSYLCFVVVGLGFN